MSTTSDMQIPLKWRGTTEPLESESEKADLQLNVQKTKILASSPITSWQIEGGKVEAMPHFLFLGSQITADGDCSHEIKRCLLFRRKDITNLDSVLKNRDIAFYHNGLYSQSCGFSSSHVWMWGLDHKEGWVLKNWCFQIVVLDETVKSPLDSKEIKPVNPKGNQPWIFFGRTDVEAEAPILWPSDGKSRFTGKDSDAGRDWRQKEKGEDEVVR